MLWKWVKGIKKSWGGGEEKKYQKLGLWWALNLLSPKLSENPGDTLSKEARSQLFGHVT
jgi:hypothetical protein